ncbi:MAG TPA: MFS transporter [Candidatus Krumholzibacteria bacterium]|nr:MFS transporter [Candidatus Krumholzibacteria bacterium]HRX49766.1 MFS transporter [Candidatus Krumholzibacteria bacterium]
MPTLLARLLHPGARPDPVEAATLRRYLIGMVFQGLWWAGYLLFPFVLAKSLDASAGLVTAAVTMDTAGMLLALSWGALLARGGRRRVLFWGGLGGRAVLVLAPWAVTAPRFVTLLGVVYVFAALLYPAQNGIFQENFPAARRGRYFGFGALVQHVTAASTSLLLGALLDRDPQNFRWIYPAVGLLGFGYPLMLALVPRHGDGPSTPAPWTLPRLPRGRTSPAALLRSLTDPVRDALTTIHADKAFRWFEGNFMLYGMAFMMLNPVVPLFFTDELHLSYEQISSARVLIASAGVALLGPLMGAAMDRFHPVRVSTLGFGLLSLYPLTLALGGPLAGLGPVATAYLGFAFYAVAMSGVNVTWNMGSIAFAPDGEGGHYQSVHVAMVGLRGVVGPLAGYAVLRLFGSREVFLIAAGFCLSASLSSVMLWRWLRTQDHPAGE